ncbi:MAG: nitroreductase family deazaflavin-dependent oxidoreductase [Frankiales bacterium]|jgi:deazaflavin-dependent oxidoreductase (nitroreductase family)|nr:nitroreductase family deazaflavin-dependent oxidoreductase [Frankiales bacterium]
MTNPPVHIHERNRQITEEFRANGGRLTQEGMPIMLLTHKGRKSGREYTNPLAFAVDQDEVIIAGTMGGSPKHPEWFLNLEADPAVTVEYDGQTYQGRAEVVTEPADRAHLVELVTQSLPALPRYEEKAAGHRVIPIVRLRRV